MRCNMSVALHGDRVILVPYRRLHVPKYHKWMKSEELQLLTASDPLTLDEEYLMQETWQQDEDKCTFIILNKATYEATNDEVAELCGYFAELIKANYKSGLNTFYSEAMIGDTNIFLNRQNHEGEIEIMIADKEARGKRLGWESVIMMLLYGINSIHINRYEAKISDTNTTSSRLFEKLGFKEISRSDVFKEVTLEKNVNNEWMKWLCDQQNYIIKNHQ